MADEEAVAAVRTEGEALTDEQRAAVPHDFEGVVWGVADRPCTLCGKADRDPIHAVAAPASAAALLGAEHMPHIFRGGRFDKVCDFCGRPGRHEIHTVGPELSPARPVEVAHKVIVGERYIDALEHMGLIPPQCTAVHVYARVGKLCMLRYEVFADERLVQAVEAGGMAEPAEGEQPGAVH